MAKEQPKTEFVTVPGGTIAVVVDGPKHVQVRRKGHEDGMPTVACTLNKNGSVDVQVRSGAKVNLIMVDDR